jgi:hypothetical protein
MTGTAVVVNATGGTIAITDNSHVDVNGSGVSTVLVGSSDEAGIRFDGGSFSVNGNNSYLYNYGNNGSISLNGSADIGASTGSFLNWNLYGDNGEANLIGYHTNAYMWGNYQTVAPMNSTNYAVIGNRSPMGVGDVIKGWGDYTINYRHMEMGFAGSHTAVAATLAQHDEADADLNAGIDEIRAAIDVNAPRVFSGTIFDHPVITWTISGDNPLFSGKLDAADELSVKSAFAAWAAVTGLKFVEVSGNATADIQIGFGKFGTSSSGIIGLTGITSDENGIAQDSLIRIEDKSETPIAKDGIYMGTDATESQVLMHEIGHALGLGDNVDPNSVESFYLGGSNRGISESDAELMRQLYWPVEGHTTPFYSDSVSAAMALMASFGPSSGNSAVHIVGVQSGRGAAMTMHDGF